MYKLLQRSLLLFSAITNTINIKPSMVNDSVPNQSTFSNVTNSYFHVHRDLFTLCCFQNINSSFYLSKNSTFTKLFFIFIKSFQKKFRIRQPILISANKCEHFAKFSCIAIVFLLIMVWYALNYKQTNKIHRLIITAYVERYSGKAKQQAEYGEYKATHIRTNDMQTFFYRNALIIR